MKRRIATLGLIAALLSAPTSAFALEGDTPDAEPATRVTDRPTDERPTDLSDAKARALATIDQQLAALAKLRAAIGSARHITADHASHLLRDVSTAVDGLTELARAIEAASTAEGLRALIDQIGMFQIAHVLAPKTHQVIASDTVTFAVRQLDGYAGKLRVVIGRFESAGFDLTEAWRLLEDMQAHTAEAARLGSPVADTVIWLEPSDWPDPAQAVLADGRADLAAAGSALRSAKGAAGKIVEYLRSLIDTATD
jgi:hypothetical protein